MEQSAGTIGQSVVISGELDAQEDLTIEGSVDGKVTLNKNVLTIGTNGRVTAQVTAKVVVVMGKVTGNISASEQITVRETASIEGDLTAPRVAIADGADYRGSIDMRSTKEVPAASQPQSQPQQKNASSSAKPAA